MFFVNSPLAQAARLDIGASRNNLLAELKTAGVVVEFDRQSGIARFAGAKYLASVLPAGVSPGAPPAFNAMVLVEKYGLLFGLQSPRQELAVRREGRNGSGGGMVRYQQLFNGIPVFGGELLVNMDQSGGLLSMNGRIGTVAKNLAVTPAIDQTQAAATAVAAVAKWYHQTPDDLEVTAPELSVYDPHLLGPGSALPARLVWRLEVRSRKLEPIRELVLVDAQRGGLALHFNQVDTVKARRTYSANNSSILPGTLKCTETNGNACTNGLNPEADYAHLYAGASYDFYLNYHNRDSYDGAGAAMVSTVNFNDDSCPNAYWNGSQMVYCNGFAQADDVVAHELTHAVTERTSGLFYYYQSGAINESFSDLWGEFVDLTDGSGTDTSAMRWKMGEDLNPSTGMGILRDMKNPPFYHHPDKMTSIYYQTIADDQGGVHTNSGVNNKAIYLLTDGGIFNGRTISGLGITKVAKIYYEVQTNLLTSGSDYFDLNNALNQACTNLIGTAAITVNDCNQVLAATAAVELNQQPVANFNPDAQVCQPGKVVSDVFFDDFENGLGKWALTVGSGTQSWLAPKSTYGLSYATSGVESLFGPDIDSVTDQRATITVLVPSGQPYLFFRHAYDFEYFGPNYFDGGVLEYSLDNGASWINALSLVDSGRHYNGTIYSGLDNPLKGSKGFVGTSNGYVSTRLNIVSLAGKVVKFRWRVGTDSGTGTNYGWFLDDVRVYTCNATPTANAGTIQTVARGAAVTLDGRSSFDSDGAIATYAWIQTGGTAVVLNNAQGATPDFKAPATLGTLTFQLTVTDDKGGVSSATTSVMTINAPPVAVAGPAQSAAAGTTVTLNGSVSSDGDGLLVGYAWEQTAGATVTLSNAGIASPTFTAPASATTLSFRLTVTDNDGASANSTTTVTVSVPAAAAPAADDGGGGGGCSLSRDGRSDHLLLLLLPWAVVMMLRRRHGQA